MLLLRPTAGVAAMTALARPSNLPALAAADLSGPALLDLAASSTLTSADVLAALPNAGSTTPDQQQEMASAVRTIARLLGEDPTRIPANRRALTRRMASIAPAAHGISKPSWSNVRSRLNAALDLVLPPHLRRRRNLLLAPEWQELQGRLADQWTRKTLSRFFHFCGEAGISPERVEGMASAVTQTTRRANGIGTRFRRPFCRAPS
jgi:hypothetical protein